MEEQDILNSLVNLKPEQPKVSIALNTKLVQNINLAEQLNTFDFNSLIDSAYKKAVSNLYNQIDKDIRFNLKDTERYLLFNLNLNLEDAYARKQNALKSWGNSIAKFGVNTVGTFAQTLGSIPEVVNAISEGKIDSLYDNTYNNYWNNWMKDMNDKFINYQSDYDKEHLFLSMLNLFDKGASSILQSAFESSGYAIGGIGGAIVEDLAVGTLTEGIGLALLLASQLAKFTKSISKIDDIIDYGKGLNALEKGIEILRSYKYIDKSLGILKQLTGSMAEASIEALETKSALRKELEKDFYDKNGYSATGEELEKINSYTDDAVRQRYFANLALLTINNQIQYLNLFKDFNFSKRFLEKSDDVIIGTLKKGEEETVEGLTNLTLRNANKEIDNSIKGRFLKYSKDLPKSFIGKFSISEGLEEGFQYAIDRTVSDYAKQRMKSENTANFIASTLTGLKDMAGTEEGWINIVSGIIGGLISGGILKGIDYGKRAIDGKSIFDLNDNNEIKLNQINNLNSAFNYKSMFGTFRDKVESANSTIENESNAKEAIENDNRYEFERSKIDSILGYAKTAVENNQYEAALMQVEQLGKIKESLVKDSTGIDQENIGNEISKVKRFIKDYKDIHENIETKFSSKKYKSILYYWIKDELKSQLFRAKLLKEKAENLNSQISLTNSTHSESLERLLKAFLLMSIETDEGYSFLKRDYSLSGINKLMTHVEKELENDEELSSLVLEYKERVKRNRKFLNSIKDSYERLKSSENGVELEINKLYDNLTNNGSKTNDVIQEELNMILDAEKYKKELNHAIDKYNLLLTPKGQEDYILNLKEYANKKQQLIVEQITKQIEQEKQSQIKKEIENKSEEEFTDDYEEDIDFKKQLLEKKYLRKLNDKQQKILENVLSNHLSEGKDIDDIIDLYKLGEDWEDIYRNIVEKITDQTFNTYDQAYKYAGDDIDDVKKVILDLIKSEDKIKKLTLNSYQKDILEKELYLDFTDLLKKEYSALNETYKNEGWISLLEELSNFSDFSVEELEQEFEFIKEKLDNSLELIGNTEEKQLLLLEESVKDSVEQILLKLVEDIRLTSETILQLTEKVSLSDLLNKSKKEVVLIENNLIVSDSIQDYNNFIKLLLDRDLSNQNIYDYFILNEKRRTELYKRLEDYIFNYYINIIKEDINNTNLSFKNQHGFVNIKSKEEFFDLAKNASSSDFTAKGYRDLEMAESRIELHLKGKLFQNKNELIGEKINLSLSLFKNEQLVSEENMNLIDKINKDINNNRSLIKSIIEEKNKKIYDKQKSVDDFLNSLGCKK